MWCRQQNHTIFLKKIWEKRRHIKWEKETLWIGTEDPYDYSNNNQRSGDDREGGEGNGKFYSVDLCSMHVDVVETLAGQAQVKSESA